MYGARTVWWSVAATLFVGACGDDPAGNTQTGVAGVGGTGGAGGAGGHVAPGGGGHGGDTGPCPPGTADCDSDGACETITTNSPTNCGACGHDCLGGSCVDAECQPVLLADVASQCASCSTRGLALDATTVYFGYGDAGQSVIAKVPKVGGNATTVCQGDPGVGAVTVDADHVYWSASWHGVYRVPIGGGAPAPLWSGSAAGHLALDSTSLYWFDITAQQLLRMDLTGTNQAVLDGSVLQGRSLSVAAGFLFGTFDTVVAVWDLSDPTTGLLANADVDPRGVVGDATHAYWAAGGTNDTAVWRRDRTSAGAREHLAAVSGVAALALDDAHLYVADDLGASIWRLPKTGGELERLCPSDDSPFAMAVDDVAVYWTTRSGARVYKVAK